MSEGVSEVSERASEQVSAAEGASEASSPEQANEWAVRVNEQTDERVAQYYSLYSWLLSTITGGQVETSQTKKIMYNSFKNPIRCNIMHQNH